MRASCDINYKHVDNFHNNQRVENDSCDKIKPDDTTCMMCVADPNQSINRMNWSQLCLNGGMLRWGTTSEKIQRSNVSMMMPVVWSCDHFRWNWETAWRNHARWETEHHGVPMPRSSEDWVILLSMWQFLVGAESHLFLCCHARWGERLGHIRAHVVVTMPGSCWCPVEHIRWYVLMWF